MDSNMQNVIGIGVRTSCVVSVCAFGLSRVFLRP